MKSVKKWFQRLTSREKVLVSVLIGSVVVVSIFIYFFVTISAISDLEMKIDEGKFTFQQIDRLLLKFLKKKHINDQLKEKIVKNPIKSLRIPINDIAKTIMFETEYGSKYLSDVIRFEGKTKEKKLFLGKKKKIKKGKTSRKGFWQIEQDVDFSSIPVKAFYEFIAKINNSDKILFITKLDALRKYNDPNQVRVSLTIGTIKYIKQEEEE